MQSLKVALLGVSTVLFSGCQILPPSSVPTAPTDAQRVQAAGEEGAAWEIAALAKDSETIQAYLDRFPAGAHAASAQLRLKLIQKGAIK